MFNDFLGNFEDSSVERNAYNAAFYELGFRWHWDDETYTRLLSRSRDASERVLHYLQAEQPHILRAYDADFIVEVIHKKIAVLEERKAAIGETVSGHFDWAEMHGCEIGA